MIVLLVSTHREGNGECDIIVLRTIVVVITFRSLKQGVAAQPCIKARFCRRSGGSVAAHNRAHLTLSAAAFYRPPMALGSAAQPEDVAQFQAFFLSGRSEAADEAIPASRSVVQRQRLIHAAENIEYQSIRRANLEYWCCLILSCAHDVHLSFQRFSPTDCPGACENLAATPRAIAAPTSKAT